MPKIYEVVKDHKSGQIKVFSHEEKPDPFSRASILRYDENKRARIASLKSWWVALRYAWRDEAQRTRIVANALFFAGLLVFPLGYAVVVALGAAFGALADGRNTFLLGSTGILAFLALLGAVVLGVRIARNLFRR